MHVHVFTHKMHRLFSLQRQKQNLSDRDRAIMDLAKEFDFKGTFKTGAWQFLYFTQRHRRVIILMNKKHSENKRKMDIDDVQKDTALAALVCSWQHQQIQIECSGSLEICAILWRFFLLTGQCHQDMDRILFYFNFIVFRTLECSSNMSPANFKN